jgi:signal transduction histidine kinase/DNA-binding response OmpR family regulator
MFNALAVNAIGGSLLVLGLWLRLRSTLTSLEHTPVWAKPLDLAIIVSLVRFSLAYGLYSGLLNEEQARVLFGVLLFAIGVHLPLVFDAFAALTEYSMPRLRRAFWVLLPATGAAVGWFGVAQMEMRQPNGFNVSYIDGKLAPIAGILTLFVILSYLVMIYVVKNSNAPRLKTTRHIIVYAIAINIAVLTHDLVVALQGLNNPYLSILGMIAFGVGLTLAGEERSRLEIDNLRRETHEAEAQAEARTSFLSHMSHQVRTPLTEIRGLQYLLQERAEGRRQAELAEALGTSAEILRTLIDDLLDYESIDAGLLELEHNPFSPKQLHDDLRQFAALLPKAPALQLEFEYHGPSDLLVIGDGARLRQVLLNLLSNALKFTPEGWVRVTMWATQSNGQAQLRAEISDSGIGIDPNRKERIFDSFTQGESGTSRRYEGSGLGLAISKRLANLLNASLHVESRPNEGSTFHLKLSLPILSERDPNGTDSRSVSPDAEALRGVQILVVEDTPTNLLITRLLLEEMGCHVATASDGMEALETLQTSTQQIVLMDLQMAPWDGIETTKRIRKGEDYEQLVHDGRIPIIAVTADVSPLARTASNEAGCDAFLAKPFTRHELLVALWQQLPRIPQGRHEHAAHVSTPPISTPLLLQATHGQQELAIRRLEKFQRSVMEFFQDLQNAQVVAESDQRRQTERWLREAEELGLSELQVILSELLLALAQPDDPRWASVLEGCWEAHRNLQKQTLHIRQSFETAAYPQGKTQEFPDLPPPTSQDD